MTSIPALELEEKEADALAKAVVNVADQYPSVLMTPQTAAWIGLATTLGMVYGTRVMTIRMQVAESRAARVARGQAPDPTFSPVA